MSNKTTKQQNSESELEIQNPFTKSKNIQVHEEPDRNLVTLRIYGEIEEPEEYVDEIAKLDKLSEKYDVIEITLNSPGGSLSTSLDLVSVIKKYSYIITIGKGEVASAAFMIWTMGNLRVVTEYSMYMAHRESYGMYGKTSEHRDMALTFGKVYEELFEDCFGELLTDKEKAIAERSEAYLSYKELLERPRVISFEEYINPANPYTVMDTYIVGDGRMFMFDMETQSYRLVKVKFGDDLINDMTDYLYGMTKITKLPKPKKSKKKDLKSNSKNNEKDS